jgi:hypothetical protein
MSKAYWAEILLKDENFQQMMEELRSQEIAKFATSDYGQVEVRESAYRQLRAIESIETYLEGLASDKLIEEKRLKIL